MTHINFILSNNGPHSHTRNSIEYANILVRLGCNVTISYPVIGYFDYLLERPKDIDISSNNLNHFFHLIKASLNVIRKIINLKNYSFRGKSMTKNLNKNIVFNRYLFKPSESNMPDSDAIVVFQNYILKHLIDFQPSKGVIIGSIHTDYEIVIQQNKSEFFEKRMVALDQKINVDRFAVGESVKKAAQNLGVNVNCVINNAVDVKGYEKNNIAHDRIEGMPIIVSLSCFTRPQKGLSYGCDVIKKLRGLQLSNVKFHSIGNLPDEYNELFDVNHGFLSGDSYYKALCASNIYIYPSLYDGFPAPPLEAMACGSALVTTLVAGVDEWAKNEKNCLVSMPKDVDKMFDNVLRLINDRKLEKLISNNGVETALNYSWESQTKKLLKYVKSCIP